MRFIPYASTSNTISIPNCIRTERYTYCDNFISDYLHTDRFSLLTFVRNLLRK